MGIKCKKGEWFVLLFGMIIGVDKRAGFWHARWWRIQDFKITSNWTVFQTSEEQLKKEKGVAIKFWKSKGKYTVSNDNTSALLYDGKQVCAYFIADSVTVSCLILCDSLLQSDKYFHEIYATNIITKCDSYFITKCDRTLLQSAPGFFLQNATILWENAAVITNCCDFVIECNSYYKMRRLLQIAMVQCQCLWDKNLSFLASFY